jgi:serine/threonine protein kinase
MTAGPEEPDDPGADSVPTRTTSVAALPEEPPARGPRAGTRIEQYVLQTELGRGGMGQVFLALDAKLDRKVAIKFVSVKSPTLVTRFMSEARVTAKCTHPNIVVIHDISEHQGLPFMVLEYVRGASLATLLRDGAMPPERVVRIALQVARALAYAHSRGVIHRDLKPANILLSDDGAVKVVDFGIAKHFDLPDAAIEEGAAAPAGEATAAGEILGTLQYMAPEQVNKQPIDARVDIWAFGVTLFQMLHGKRPLHDLGEADVVAHYRDLDRKLPSLAALHPELPPPLVELIERCLEKRLDRRLQTSAGLVAVLDAMVESPATGDRLAASVADGVPTQDPVPTRRTELELPPPPPRWRRRPVLLGAAFAALAALALVAFLIGRSAPRRAGPADDAASEARLDELDGELDRLERTGATAEAERLFQDFLEQERDAAVVARAWLRRGDRARLRRDLDAGQLAYSNAFARAADPVVQRDALVRLAAIYLDRWEWPRLAAAIAVYDRRAPARPAPVTREGAMLRDRLMLAKRAPEARDSLSPATAAAATLLTGRAVDLPIEGILAVDVERDGTEELVTIEDGTLVLRGRDTLDARGRWPIPGLAALRCVGSDAVGAYAAVLDGTGWQLARLDGPGERVGFDLVRPGTPSRCLWVDLDGDDRVELYVIGARSLFRVDRDGAGAWHATTHPLGSEPAAILGGDLDGDGTRELIVAVGEWRAYDVRVLRFGDDGALQIADRIRLGAVSDLAMLGRDGDGRALIAALKQDAYPSIKVMPPGEPFGAAAGVYVLAYRAGRLEVLRRVDLEWPVETDVGFEAMRAGDVDGDGRVDLITEVCLPERNCDLAVLLGEEGGGFAFRVLSGMHFLEVVPADDDPQAEVVVRIDGGATPWILGAGDAPVPALDFPVTPQQMAPRSALSDDAVAAAWQRAEDLAAIGLVEAASDALRRIAAIGAGTDLKRDALRRAAALLGSRRLPAGQLFEALAALEPRGSAAQLQAWLAAVDDHVAAAEIEPARRLIATLLAEPDWPLPTGDRARVEALRGELAASPVVLFAGGALETPWRVLDPTLAHVPLGSRELAVETLVPGPVAVVPLARRDGLLTLSITAKVTRNEWAGSLVFRLGPRDRASGRGVDVAVTGRGGGGIYRREITCGGDPTSRWAHAVPMPGADDAVDLRVELTLLPGRRIARCAFTIGGETDGTVIALDAGDERAWELSIEGGPVANMTSAAARVSRIEVSGFAVDAAAPSAAEAAALALANHRPGDAVALLDAAGDWPSTRLLAIALDESGDRRRATRLLAAAVRAGDAPVRDLARLFRARDGQLAPLVRAAYGDRVALVLDEAWGVVAAHDLDEPRVRTAIIGDLAGLPAPGKATRAATLSLLTFRGEALLAVGRPDEARRELIDALAIDPGPSPPEAIRERAERAALLLAIDASTRGDADAAARWGQRAIADSDHPELAVDMLLLVPATRSVIDPAVRALGRELYRGP